MPNYIIIDTPDAPEIGTHVMAALYRVTADTEADALNTVAVSMKISEPKAWFIVEESVFGRYVSTPTYSVSSALG